MFKGRRLVIATKHEKEKVIAPLFETALDVQCEVPDNFDTDQLGTFTGEIERGAGPIATARQKCLQAMEASQCDLAIANEGSFGAHPTIFFAAADDEFIILIDKKNNLEIVERELSTDTNFNAEVLQTEKQLIEFAKRANFPSHALILRKSKDDFSEMIKGVSDWDLLKNTFTTWIEMYGTAYVETDMRAMYNPTRMAVIEKAAKKLLAKVQALCPQCHTAGFGVSNVINGLPCGLCGSPTRSTLSAVYTCTKCSYTKEVAFPNRKLEEDPMYCDRCNP